ncbi:SAM-dependent methyltransferase [Rhodococcoides trifolii]|uniref:SAM-dependent methyltransferase n=1 Tax=Rhodococcoides trifolii TaxID=908250 RepID=A0A917FNZ3_9NOCA|nr:methyltransferase domain-containing protein [Rhodococcus trifolii]GGF93834.1 SAM-dependent methyltransferase [Rhodococcus trifolii]
MDAADWDATVWDTKYAGQELKWGSPPNQFVVEFTTSLPPGRALDLACGEGRNALWLATRGWTVDAVDFSAEGLRKGVAVARTATNAIQSRLRWVRKDVTELIVEPNYDLVLVLYLHLQPGARKQVVDTAISALKPEGILVICGHDSANLTDGVGGPQDPQILYTPADLVNDIDGRLDVRTAETRRRDLAEGSALDAVVFARKTDVGSATIPA